MPSPNSQLAAQLAEIAALLRASRADRFRVRAYDRAARVVNTTPLNLAELDPEQVRRLEGIGDAMAGLIAEYLETGRIALLDELRKEEPAGFGALLALPLIGLRDARQLSGVHGFSEVAGLREAAQAPGGLDALDERLAARVRESLRRFDATAGEETPMPIVRRDAAELAARLRELPQIDDVIVAGALRRAVDTVGSLDIVIVTEQTEQVAAAVMASRAVVALVERSEEHLTVVSPAGRHARIWITPAAAAGVALLLATGSDAHVSQLQERAARSGHELGAEGLCAAGRRIAGATEEEVYEALGLAFVPPELREAAGEISAARDRTLPELVGLTDLRGDLHVHSDWSRDGNDELEHMVIAAAGHGYEYVAITDHAENLTINGMPRETVLARRHTIAEVQRRHPGIRILDGAELNIGLEGDLDYDLDFLLRFEFTVASIHSHMDREVAVQTDRILAAIEHPAVHVIGHPTGRILGHRPGYEIELTAIAQAAAETGTALEVNGSARRLDLSGEMIRIAVEAGATVALSSDAHSVSELASVANAAPTARRGWASPAAVLNCRDTNGLLAFTQRKREGRQPR